MATLTNFIILLHLIAYCFILPTLTNAESKKDYINLSENYFQSNNIPNTPKKQIVMNAIDSCWRTNSKWASNRQSLANCAKGFGSNATGGKFGEIYEVTNPSDDPINPKQGTLRYGVIQTKPLWITFAKDMSIKLENELIVNSYKTIDGRGVKVEIANRPCITIQHASHVIVHGISIHHCIPSVPGRVDSSFGHAGKRDGSDGDGITVFASSDIWIDHCFFESCADGLIDVIHASTSVTISNNYFTNHDKVMLLGHSDKFHDDIKMKVTVAFNHFASNLTERMPRVRFGYAHVVNNRYDGWNMYAIGGSANSTIFSQANLFIASKDSHAKLEVTKRLETYGRNWKNWQWRSYEDKFMNGAYFKSSGNKNCCEPFYSQSQYFDTANPSMVPLFTRNAGPLHQCVVNKAC